MRGEWSEQSARTALQGLSPTGPWPGSEAAGQPPRPCACRDWQTRITQFTFAIGWAFRWLSSLPHPGTHQADSPGSGYCYRHAGKCARHASWNTEGQLRTRPPAPQAGTSLLHNSLLAIFSVEKNLNWKQILSDLLLLALKANICC